MVTGREGTCIGINNLIQLCGVYEKKSSSGSLSYPIPSALFLETFLILIAQHMETQILFLLFDNVQLPLQYEL
jgi:hypothetical protein